MGFFHQNSQENYPATFILASKMVAGFGIFVPEVGMFFGGPNLAADAERF